MKNARVEVGLGVAVVGVLDVSECNWINPGGVHGGDDVAHECSQAVEGPGDVKAAVVCLSLTQHMVKLEGAMGKETLGDSE